MPTLLSYLQERVDAEAGNGRFVITGSHQLELRAAVAQSLAGRTAILTLYPLSIAELSGAGKEWAHFDEYLLNGFLPRVHDESQRPVIAYANYLQTYVERDVRPLIRLKDVALFEKFLTLLAGRVGHIVNYRSLGNDVGIDDKTVKEWLSVLEASFVVFRLQPYFENFGKRERARCALHAPVVEPSRSMKSSHRSNSSWLIASKRSPALLSQLPSMLYNARCALSW